MKSTIDMAREAGAIHIHKQPKEFALVGNYAIKAFEALVRADAIAGEREACAKVCDEQVVRSVAAIEKSKRTTDLIIYQSGAQTAAWNAAAIRARGEASIRRNT